MCTVYIICVFCNNNNNNNNNNDNNDNNNNRLICEVSQGCIALKVPAVSVMSLRPSYTDKLVD